MGILHRRRPDEDAAGSVPKREEAMADSSEARVAHFGSLSRRLARLLVKQGFRAAARESSRGAIEPFAPCEPVEPLGRNAAHAIQRSSQLPSDGGGRIGVFAEVGGSQHRSAKV